MKNLNKYTKAELISKLKNKRLENTNSNSITEGIISKLLLFKSLILKLTLITLVITWIKKYTLLRKFWHIFSMIGSTLLGLSMIDIYAFDFINWLKDTNIYKWYSELFNKPVVETKIESDNKINPSSTISSSNNNTTRNEERVENSIKISDWINRRSEETVINQEDMDEIKDTPFYSKYKYFAIGAVIGVTCLVSWYYYGDNITSVGQSGIEKIKTSYGAIIDYLSSFRSTPPDDPGGSNSSGSAISDKSNIRAKLDKYFKTPDARKIDDAASEIELLDNSQPIASSSNLDNGKGVLTSASLEDLNNQAAESWGEGSSSPKSESSSSTITPSKFESSSSPIDTIPLEFVTKTWKFMFSKDIREKMNNMDAIFDDENEITKDQAKTLADSLAYLMNEYNNTIKSIQNINSDVQEIRAYKQSFYHFRQFLSFYYERIVDKNDNPITIGTFTDDLELLKLLK